MKKLILIALIAIGLSTTAFATDENKISITIRENFKEDFKGVNNVEWTLRPDFVKATFTEKGHVVDAFYNFKGYKIGTAHTVGLTDLPLSARKIIKNKYPDGKITEAIEFTGTDESAYYVTLEDKNATLVLKITDLSSVSLFKKTRKNNFW